MSVIKGDWEIVSGAIRKHHPKAPIAIFGGVFFGADENTRLLTLILGLGHTHTRFCRQFESNTMALESGRFMETVGELLASFSYDQLMIVWLA